MPWVDESDPVNALLYFTLDHGVDSVKAGGPLVPFAITEKDSKRAIQRFVAERLEESVALMAQWTADELGRVDRAAIAYDGFITLEGKRTDAIYAEALDHSLPESRIVAQRYRPRHGLRGFRTIGNPATLGDWAPRLLKRPEESP
jgi:hypothetical protein